MEPTTLIEKAFRLNPLQKIGLKKLKLETVQDLLFYFPNRYEEPGQIRNIRDLSAGEEVVIYGKVLSTKTLKGWKTKIPMAEAIIDDGTKTIKAVWFHQAYMAKKIPTGHFGEFRGKITKRQNEIYLANPDVRETLPTIGAKNSLFSLSLSEEETTNDLFLIPVYSETKGLSSGWFYYHIQTILKTDLTKKLIDHLPEKILKQYHLPKLKTALVWIHSPKKTNDATIAKKRFAFEEILYIQIKRLQDKHKYQNNPSFKIKVPNKDIEEFLNRFPFSLTKAQDKAIKQIIADFSGNKPMTRLLEGDVGSGKTAVAATTAFAVVKSGYEVAYMAPTEILARQHFESFIEYFKHIPNIGIGLITGSECRKFPSKLESGHTHLSRTQLLKWVADGRIPILIGTHSLIQKTVKFKNLAYSIIDEQHRFGIYQRAALVRRSNADKTPINANANDDFLYRDLSYSIRNAVFNVANSLGLGHKEVIYQRALEEEFRKNKIDYSREKQIPIYYNDKKIGTYIPDFVIDNKIIIELKSLPFLGTAEKKQTWNYLKGSDYKLALLINFSPKKVEIERIIYDKARTSSASHLLKSASCPHLLSMTATPIPRTLALTIYGDLDLTLLDEMPKGRKSVITEIVAPTKRQETYEFIRQQIKTGRQAYVICPRIDEPDPDKKMALNAKSVVAEQIKLGEQIFPEFMVGLVHGKMKPKEKEEMMNEFTAGKIDILVATSVIEVGVNVPNSTIIIIEGAERFGLAQLHQLRGRVLRSNHQAYCFLFSDTKSTKSLTRLKALQTAKNGFELAEQDLALRGAGGLAEGKQWGISDIGMEAIKNIKMVEAARTEAQKMIDQDSELTNLPLIRSKLGQKKSEVHFE